MSWQDLDTTFIIGEAGTCHADPDPQKRLDKALRYTIRAAEAGVDAIKFQMFSSPIGDMFCWIEGDEERSSRWLESTMELGEWRAVKRTAETHNIMFLASVFQDKTVDWLNILGVEATKVASRAVKDFPFSTTPEPYLVSDGMYPVPDRRDVIGLECEAKYPSTAWWRGNFPGFSDHSGGMARAVDAIENGCRVLEVHFYLDEKDAGPDLPASLTIDELAVICRARNVCSLP